MVRPTIVLPGYFAGATPYLGLAAYLTQQGFPTVVVPLEQRDWFPTLGGRPVTPILQRLHETIEQALARYQPEDGRVNLVGHSAGGWVSRIYLGDRPYPPQATFPGTIDRQVWNGRGQVATLLCLGTPHLSQERWTRRNINFVNEHYPGAFYPDLRYVCVAGKAIEGQRGWLWFRHKQGWRATLAYNSYSLTCGVGNSWGDGITPIVSAHLDGALNITLEGVVHSPGAALPWYGSPAIVDEWCRYLAP